MNNTPPRIRVVILCIVFMIPFTILRPLLAETDFLKKLQDDYSDVLGDPNDPYADYFGGQQKQDEPASGDEITRETPEPTATPVLDSATLEWLAAINAKVMASQTEAPDPATLDDTENRPVDASAEAKEDQLPQDWERTVGKPQTSGDFGFIVTQDGSALLTKYSGTVRTLVVPSTLRGHPVQGIDDGAFRGSDTLRHVTLPDTVQWAGIGVFENCTKLEQAILPLGLSDVGPRMFAGCTSLESVRLPDALTSISIGMFQYCESLRKIVVPGKVISIDTSAFFGCDNLEDVRIPATVHYIAENAFLLCQQVWLDVRLDSYAYDFAISHNIRYMVY